MPTIFAPQKNRLHRRDIPDSHVRLGSPKSFNGPKTTNKEVDGSTFLGLEDCDQFITPICLQTLYNFVNVTPSETDRNTFGVVEFTPQAFLQGDLSMCPLTTTRAHRLTTICRLILPQFLCKPSWSKSDPRLHRWR